MVPATTPALRSNNGVTMPALGLGVFQSPAKETAIDALDTGVRGGPDPALLSPETYPKVVDNS